MVTSGVTLVTIVKLEYSNVTLVYEYKNMIEALYWYIYVLSNYFNKVD